MTMHPYGDLPGGRFGSDSWEQLRCFVGTSYFGLSIRHRKYVKDAASPMRVFRESEAFDVEGESMLLNTTLDAASG